MIAWHLKEMLYLFLYILHICDSMDVLEDVIPSMFADITVVAAERCWLFASDILMVCGLCVGGIEAYWTRSCKLAVFLELIQLITQYY